MDVRGLIKKPAEALKRIRPALGSRVSFLENAKGVLPVAGLIFLFVLVIGGLWWFSPYVDELYSLLPGYYENKTYNELTQQKNDLIEENARFLSKNDDLETELATVEADLDGYARMAEIDSEIISSLDDIRTNMGAIIDLDMQFLEMRLPEVVSHYVKLSYDVDEVRKDLIETSLDISSGRRDLAEFNTSRVKFDNCLADVDWAGQDKAISDAVAVCVEGITSMQEKVVVMEDRYEVSLDGLSKYLTLLSEEWTANYQYYGAISEGDYTKANEYDAIFVEKKRAISEIDVNTVFDEFYEEALVPLREKFIGLSEDEREKDRLANEWYENNVQR